MARSDKMPGLNSLCTPAYLYFLLSIAMLIFSGIIMNTDMMKSFCAGKCSPVQVILFFLLKLVFIIFWTWVLNVLCRGGAGWLAWFMVVFPFIMILSTILITFGNVLGNIGMSGPHNFPVKPMPMPMQMPMNVVAPGPMMGQSQPVNIVAPGPMMGLSQPMLVNGMPSPKM
jgi:hypothetical protein